MQRNARSRDARRRDEEQKAGSLTPDVSRSGSPNPGYGTHRNRRRPNRVVLLLAALATVLLVEAATRSPRTAVVDLAYLFRYKLLDHACDEQWTSPIWALVGLRAAACSLRKEPLVFVRGDASVAIVWESNACQDGQDWRLRWRHGGSSDWHSAPVHVTTVRPNRLVYTAPVDTAHETRIDYELALSSFSDRVKTKRKYSIAWRRPERHPHTINIACVADNQFNVRTFRRVLLRLAAFGRSGGLSPAYFAPDSRHRRPDLLLHAGDVVQDPDNHAQWQTDFWDALTRGGLGYPFGQETPLLLARGNHDWDATGSNAYTGGPGLRAGTIDLQDDELAKRGTYLAYSPHPRMRIVVLDSNLPTDAEQLEQERWLLWELGQPTWSEASLKVAVVHTAPWIEWWDRRAWNEGGERRW